MGGGHRAAEGHDKNRGELDMSKEENEKKLQELLLDAENAIRAVKDFAVENDLMFQIDGLRRGPVEEDDDYGGGMSTRYLSLDENDERDEDDKLPVRVQKLDINYDWLPSMC